MADPVLSKDVFSIMQLDPDGKKSDKVSRISAHNEQFEMNMLLDVYIDMYPLHKGEKFMLALASTINLDGSLDNGKFDPSRRILLADKYEYVMYGNVYMYNDTDATLPREPKVEVYVSFGGLEMCLKGNPDKLESLTPDRCVYLLMRKV